MLYVRSLPWRRAIPIIAAIAFLAPASAARAARPPVPPPVSELAGPNFVIHYTSTGGASADRLTPEGAATALANAETALGWYLSQGYPPPLSDGDGKTDIYVFNVPIGPAAGRDSESADQTSGYILLTPAANNLYAVSHELFHVIQFAIFSHAGFFSESSAEWAGQAVAAANGSSPPPNWFPDPQVPLDCLGSACGDAAGGYRGSIFWEYLRERYGAGVVHEAYARDAALGSIDHQAHDLQALGEALAVHGSSVPQALNGYALAAVAGQITRPGVLPHLPAFDHAFGAELPVEYVPDTVSVDHLAMKVIAFYGAGNDEAQCTNAVLKLRVDLPPGVPSEPVFVTYPPSGLPPASAIYPLAIAGSVASADVPWATCSASGGALALPNGSTSADDQPFAVHVTVALGPGRRRPRLLGRSVQHVSRLSIRVLAYEATSLQGQASVALPGTRAVVRSHPVKVKAKPGRPLTLRFRFSRAKLKKIEALLDRHPLRAKILVTARGSEGGKVTLRRSIRLKP